MHKIVSFGDSFVFGSELKNNHNGSKAWPGLVARDLGVEYKTFANPGCGNDYIAQQIYSYFSTATSKHTLAVINWTWSVRWDFYITKEVMSSAKTEDLGEHISEEQYNLIAGSSWPEYKDFLKGDTGSSNGVQHEIANFVDNIKCRQNGQWIGLGPTCVPEKLSWLNDSIEAKRIINFYRDYGIQNLLWNKFRNLQTIFAAQKYLEQKNICTIQTFMDYELFDSEYKELAPDYIKELQLLVKPNMQSFHCGMNFLDWAISSKYPVTASPGDHPLEEAHNAAKELWIDRYSECLK